MTTAPQHMHFACVALSLFSLFLFLCALSPGAQAAEEDEFVVRRPFSGMVRRDMAERALRVAAEVEAMKRAVQVLGREKAFSAEDPGASHKTDFALDGLARLVFKVRQSPPELEGFPPAVQVAARVRLEEPEDIRNALQEALARRDLIEIYGKVLASRRKLLAAYDERAAALLALNPSTDGGMGKVHALQRTCHEMDALDILVSLLAEVGEHGQSPEKAHRELVKAQALAPDNPLVGTALAEVLIQQDRPVAALEQVGAALKRDPEYARAHDVRGAVLLRQRLPGLAVDSFSRAIALSPGNVDYRVHRAAAYLLLGNDKGMCDDFIEACGMGVCDGLHWARSVEKCEVKNIEQ